MSYLSLFAFGLPARIALVYLCFSYFTAYTKSNLESMVQCMGVPSIAPGMSDATVAVSKDELLFHFTGDSRTMVKATTYFLVVVLL